MNVSQRMRRLGWQFFSLMWIPFITLMIGMIGMPEGSYEWAELPPLSRYSLIGVGVFALVSTVLLIGSPIVAGMKNRAVLANGQPAEARILEIRDTGTTINNDPVVRFLLEVHPPDGSPFQAETERLISRLEIPQIQPGTTLRVKYDPESHAVALGE